MSGEAQRPIEGDGWWVKKHNKEHGPMEADQLLQYIEEKLINGSDLIRGPGLNDYIKLEELANLKPTPTENTARSPAAPNSKLSAPVGQDVVRSARGRASGRIKFLDAKTRKWGYIIPDQGGSDVHYSVREIVGEYKEEYLDGAQVTFEVGADLKDKPTAKRIEIVKYPDRPSKIIREPIVRGEDEFSHRGKALWEWAYIPFSKPHRYDDEDYPSVIHALKAISLHEKWHLGNKEDNDRYPLLQKYIMFTFERLKNQDKIFYAEQDGQRWAVLNTGLVDKVYDPIYMLFTQSRSGRCPWRLYNICVEGKRDAGKRLASVFSPCPPAAKYLDKATDLIILPGADILIDDEHIIEDAIEDDRFPSAFLHRYAPRALDWDDYTRYSKDRKEAFLKKYRKLLEDDIVRYREVKNRILDAIELAKKRTFWNYKTAIPSYYPKHDQVDLLLPLCLDDQDEALVTVALVVSRNRSGSYQGRTVYPLHWAYERARVVCRPDSDWLIPESIAPRGTISSEEGEGEQVDDSDHDGEEA